MNDLPFEYTTRHAALEGAPMQTATKMLEERDMQLEDFLASLVARIVQLEADVALLQP